MDSLQPILKTHPGVYKIGQFYFSRASNNRTFIVSINTLDDFPKSMGTFIQNKIDQGTNHGQRG
jgi:hypothetical protein